MSGTAGALTSIGSTIGKVGQIVTTVTAPFGGIGNILGLVGTIAKARNQTQVANTQAAVSTRNSTVLRQQAQLVRDQASLDRIRTTKRNRAFTSRQVALFAKAGVGLSGSALEVISDDAAQLELDLLINDFNLENEARAIESDADFELFEARNRRNEGKASSTATLLTQLPNFIDGTFLSPKPNKATP